jgi:hypothetical protein
MADPQAPCFQPATDLATPILRRAVSMRKAVRVRHRRIEAVNLAVHRTGTRVAGQAIPPPIPIRGVKP